MAVFDRFLAEFTLECNEGLGMTIRRSCHKIRFTLHAIRYTIPLLSSSVFVAME